jgi:hypothetical protein
MPRNKESERERREVSYDYEIGLLIKGMSCSNVFLLSKNMGNGLSLRTIQRLKREFIDRPYER